ncbi:hypothetical protein BsWGS_19140 [Bradybaena similaris]
MCFVYLAIQASSSTEGFSANTEKLVNNVHTKTLGLGSTLEEVSERFASGTKFYLTPSFQLLEDHVPSQSFESDINSKKYLSMTTTTTLVEIEMFHKSNSNYKIRQLLNAEEGLALENTHNEVVTLGTNPAKDTHVNSTTAIAQLGANPATNQLPSSTDVSTEMYSSTDFIPSYLSTTPQPEYATMPTVLDSIAPILSNDVSATIRVSISEPSDASLSLIVTSSEQYYINKRLVTTTKIINKSLLLHPSGHSRSLLDNVSTHRSISSKDSTAELDLSLTKSLAVTSVDSDIILSNTGTTLLKDTSGHIFSVRYTNETYLISEKATRSFVDISSRPESPGQFELNTAVSRLTRVFSDLTIYPSGNYSDISSSFSVHYLPFSSTAFENTVNENAPSISDWEATTLPSGPPHEQTDSASVRSGLSTNIVGSTVILAAGFSSATGFVSQPQTADTKEWAVPVTVCLSAALLIAVCVTFITCYRSKSGHADQRDGSDIATVQTRQEQWQTGSTTVVSLSEVAPRYKQKIHADLLDKPRGDRNRIVGQRRDVVDERTPGAQSSVVTDVNGGKETFEMDSMSASARENVYTQQNAKPALEECSSDSEDLIYDDTTFTQDSPDLRRGIPERIHGSPKYVNQSGTHRHIVPIAFNKSQQKEFEPAFTFNRMSPNEPTIKTRNLRSKDHSALTTESSDSRLHYNYKTHHQQEPHEAALLAYSASNDGYVSDEYRGEQCWEDWDDRKHDDKGERDVARTPISRDSDSADGEDDGSKADFSQKVRALTSERAEHRPGMYKCVSFDESQLRTEENKLNIVSKDKSPTRKISTISESAMTYLALPQDGFVSMSTSAYETVDDLSEVGSPHSRSRFCIGSYPDQINNVGREKKAPGRILQSSAKNSFDITKEATLATAVSDEAEKVPTAKTAQDPEKQHSKPVDDYIFPIVKKANLKLLEERKNKKLVSKTSSSNDNVVAATEQMWRHSTSGRNDIQDWKSEMTKNEELSLQSPIVASTLVMPRAHRMSHTSNIPTIVLTKEEDEKMAETQGQSNMLHNVEAKPARVRRIARANNPFMIEMDSLTVSEKVRRSSAPSMTPSCESTPDAGYRDRMVRSASNDHLPSYSRANLLDPRPLRPWSSEFFDMIINSDGYSKDARFKKMIDDRYDALFSHKHSYSTVSSRHNDHSFQQDLPPRIWKLLTSSSHTSLPRDQQGNTDYFSSKEIDDTESLSTLSPILNIRKSQQSHPFSNETDRFNRERRPPWHYPELQIEIPRDNQTSTDNVAAVRSSKYATPMIHKTENVNVRILPLLDSQSARPKLAHGTDGIDSEIDMQEMANRPTNANHDKKKPNQLKSSDSNVSSSSKLTHTKAQWESFEDDFEVERLVGIGLISDNAFMSDKRRNPNSQAPISSEFPSHETTKKTSMVHNNSPRQNLTEAKRAVSPRLNVDIGSIKKSEHSQIDAPFSQSNQTVTSNSTIPHRRKVSSSSQNNQQTFEDNFSINIINVNQQTQELANKMSDTQITGGVPQGAHTEGQQKQHPQIPPRKPRRRAPRAPRLTRPPSPFLFSKGPDSQSMTFQNENDSPESETNNTHAVVDNEGDHYDSNLRPRRSLPNKRYDSSDSISIASTLGRMQQRSLSLDEKPSTETTRTQRAVTLETDQPSAHFAWTHLRFISSANNTVLQHDISLDILNDSVSLSDPEMELYFGCTVSSPNLPSRREEENVFKALLLDNSHDFGAGVSSV